MTQAILFTLIVIAIAVIFRKQIIQLLSESGDIKDKPKYQYKRKQFFMTRAEHEFYDALITVAGTDYHIFSQVHLPTILDNKVVGQDWRAAQAHINRKSVDFVLCDKAYISPKLVIELDDKSHERVDRQERDREVERILQDAGIPLLRIENHGHPNPSDLAEKIKALALK